jgi:MGT family glycosyltransferase
MGRFLVVVPPLVGHTNPTVPLGVELMRRGHAVAWTGHPEVVPELLPPDATFIPVAKAAPPEVVAAMAERLTRTTGGISGFKTMWTDFILPIARQMLPGVRAAVAGFGPDVLVVDEHALAGAAAAEVAGLPWATSATSSGDLVDPLATLPKVSGWLHEQMQAVLVEGGVDADRAAALDPRFSPNLVLAFTVAELAGPDAVFPDHYAFVGPSFAGRPEDAQFSWDWVDETRPLVLLTLGTVNWRAGAHFYAVAAEAFAEIDALAVFVAPRELLASAPPNVMVAPYVPQLALLPKVDLVVCHGGHNTVCESLAHDVPLVIAAIRDDQPIVADQVARAGAGIRIKFGRATAPMLQEAVAAVLTEPGYRSAARRLGDALRSAGGAVAAADRLEGLLKGDGS